MAFVEYNSRDVDYSTPYKTFNDLSNSDTIYIIDFKQLQFEPFTIDKYRKKEVNYNIHDHNHIEVEFTIKDTYDFMRVSDGNRYFAKVSLNYVDTYIATDERICDVIIDLLKSRNTYQYGVFSNIFGNPLEGKFEPKNVKLR